MRNCGTVVRSTEPCHRHSRQSQVATLTVVRLCSKSSFGIGRISKEALIRTMTNAEQSSVRQSSASRLCQLEFCTKVGSRGASSLIRPLW